MHVRARMRQLWYSPFSHAVKQPLKSKQWALLVVVPRPQPQNSAPHCWLLLALSLYPAHHCKRVTNFFLSSSFPYFWGCHHHAGSASSSTSHGLCQQIICPLDPVMGHQYHCALPLLARHTGFLHITPHYMKYKNSCPPFGIWMYGAGLNSVFCQCMRLGLRGACMAGLGVGWCVQCRCGPWCGSSFSL
jgi:hypothetical protein